MPHQRYSGRGRLRCGVSGFKAATYVNSFQDCGFQPSPAPHARSQYLDREMPSSCILMSAWGGGKARKRPKPLELKVCASVCAGHGCGGTTRLTPLTALRCLSLERQDGTEAG